MSISHDDCKAGLTLAGGAVSGWALFDGTGYCRTYATTRDNVDFRLYIRVNSVGTDSVVFRCYLFGRKNNTTAASYNNDANSKVVFTVGGGSATINTAKSRLPGKNSKVRCLGYTDVTTANNSSSERPLKAVFYGVPGTSDCDQTYTITAPSMDWSKGDMAITTSNMGTTSFTCKASPIVAERNIMTYWDWSVKNNTTGSDYSIVDSTPVTSDSTTTSNSHDFSNRLAGNSYTVRFRILLRNYNPDKNPASTKTGAVIQSITKTFNTNKYTGTLSLSPTSLSLLYGGSNKTVAITTNSDGDITSSTGNPEVATRSRSGKTITIVPQGLGTTALTVNVAASTAYTAPSSKTTSITVSRNPIAVAPTPNTGLVYTGSQQIGIPETSGAHWHFTGSYTGKATGAGTYTPTVEPDTGYAWKDGTYAAKTISWSIAKATDDWTIPSTLNIKINKTGTIQISGNDTGVIPIGASITPSVAVVTNTSATSVNGTITVTGRAAGSANVTVSTNETTNYNARAQSCMVTVADKDPGYATWSYTGTVNSLKETQTFTQTVSNTHGGAYSATSSNTGVATVSVSGSTATITAVGLGTSKITFTVAATATHTVAEKEVTVTVRPAEVKVGSATVPVYVGSKPVKRIYKGPAIIL